MVIWQYTILKQDHGNLLATMTITVNIQCRMRAPTGVPYGLTLAQNAENGRIRCFAISCLTRAFVYVTARTFPKAERAMRTLRPLATKGPSPKTLMKKVAATVRPCGVVSSVVLAAN